MADIKQSIIASVFSRRNASGNTEESYVSHIKIWEEAGPEGRKARYILLSQASNGTGFLHKSKLNNNGSFSVGKTWRLAELRGLQALGPLAFNITLSRTYKWQTESAIDQNNFLSALIRLFKQFAGPSAPLRLEGIVDPDAETPSRIPPVTTDSNRPQRNLRPATPQNHEQAPSLVSTPLSNRAGISIPRVASPANGREITPSARPKDPSLNSALDGQRQSRSPDAASAMPLALRPGRQLSNTRQFTPPQAPAINLPPSNRDMDRVDDSDRSRKDSNRSTKSSKSHPSVTDGPSGGVRTPATHAHDNSLEVRVPRSRTISTTGRENGSAGRKDPNARLSYFDPANQQILSRLIGSGSDVVAGADVNGHLDGEAGEEVESAQDTLVIVEEMIEGYEWASDDVIGRKVARGAADLIEARLLDELMALEKANIHSFLESDDRVGLVMKFMDDALGELDNLDGLISSYKIHLNAVNDDILHIQSQNRGLQVQTQNQRALMNEIRNLLQTVQVGSDALLTLTQESLEKSQSISNLENAASELYKALQAGRDTDIAATMERLQEYRTHNSQFCKRIYDFLTIMFSAQTKLLLGETGGLTKPKRASRQTIIQHQDVEEYLGRYCGLMLYIKEMDESVYGRLCASYFSAASELHGTQIKALLSAYLGLVKKASEEDGEYVFSSGSSGKAPSGVRRAGTLMRSPMELRNKDKDKSTSSIRTSTSSDGDLRVSEVFSLVLEQVIPLIYQENAFMADFLQINSLNNDTALTFADYMALDHYFRRQAARSNSLSSATVKLVRGAMELIFGFLPQEFKGWLEKALEKDPIEIVGVLAILEKTIADVDEKGNQFLYGFLGKQYTRLKGVFDRHINDQLKAIEQTKLVFKKRKGVAPFIKQFPNYIQRVESQLIVTGADESGLGVRESVDAAYNKIANTIFETLKAIANMDGDEEDKGQLTYHVVIIENMHYFISDAAKMDVSSVGTFTKKARGLFEENLEAYIKILFRRAFGRIIDYFEGMERLLRTLASPSDITTNPTYNKNAFRKIAKEYTIKDLRKHVDGMNKLVQKHFIDAPVVNPGNTNQDRSGDGVGRTVLLGVWRACEEELMKMTDGWKERVNQCYGEALGLEFNSADVEQAFKRHRI